MEIYRLDKDKVGRFILKKALGTGGMMIVCCFMLAVIVGIGTGEFLLVFKLLWAQKWSKSKRINLR